MNFALRAASLLSLTAMGACGMAQTLRLPKDLSSNETAALQRLHKLTELPDGPWKMHDGDLPHGESPAVDDSSWQTVNAPYTAAKGAVWFRRVVEIPQTLDGYSLRGTDIAFRFNAYANGPMPEIIYFNGRRVALGEDLEQIQLFHDAKPGEKVLVAVKLLPTVDDKKLQSAEMPITFSASRPNPDDFVKEAVSAAYLLPSIAPGDTGKRAELDGAIAAVNMRALSAANQTAFDASLKAAQAKLATLKPLMAKFNYHLTGNSHIDAAWLWPWTETVDTVKRTFTSAVQLMSEYPQYTYSQSASAYSQWMADKYPELNAQIKKRVDEGRWELVGGMWLEPDLNMPDGESQVRQLLIGQAAFDRIYGKTAKIGWNPDSFGYNWQLPQIYKRSGIDYFVTQKMAWNDTNKLPLKLFWWQAPDGSRVLTYFPHDYANDNLNPTRLAQDLATARTYSPGMTTMMDLYGIGDHGGGPTRTMLDEGDHWQQPDKAVPQYKYGTALPFFEKVRGELMANPPVWDYKTIATGDTKLPTPAEGQISVPVWNDELYLEYHRGVFTTQAKHKRNMRASEVWMLNAEKLASLAWLGGAAYPQTELNDAWKLVLFNQFHDLAAGSGIGVIYKDAQKDYDQVHWATAQVDRHAMEQLSAQADTRTKGDDVPVLVTNLLPWARGGEVSFDVQLPREADALTLLDAKNHAVPATATVKDAATHSFHVVAQLNEPVPSMGFTVLHAAPGHKDFASDLKAHDLTLENAVLRVVVDPATGCITSLFDKRASFETIASGGCGNELQAFTDKPKNYDAWNIDPGTYDVPPTLVHGVDSIALTENTPAAAAITIKRHFGSGSTITQVISLSSNAPEAVVDNTVEWHETHVLLKAAFPLAATAPMATYEIPYGSIERPTTRNNSWEKAKFEVPALRWADEGDGQHGFSLINDSKYGYDAVGNMLRLTLLRSPTWPDPDADRGEQHFRYALYPHAGSWKNAMTVERGYEFNEPLQAIPVLPHEGALGTEHSFGTLTGAHAVLSAVKKAEDAHALIFRMYEWAGESSTATLTVPPGAKSASVVNLMEQPVADAAALSVSGNTVQVPLTPYMVQTVRVEY